MSEPELPIPTTKQYHTESPLCEHSSCSEPTRTGADGDGVYAFHGLLPDFAACGWSREPCGLAGPIEAALIMRSISSPNDNRSGPPSRSQRGARRIGRPRCPGQRVPWHRGLRSYRVSAGRSRLGSSLPLSTTRC